MKIFLFDVSQERFVAMPQDAVPNMSSTRRLPSLATYYKVAGPVFFVLDFLTPLLQMILGAFAYLAPTVLYLGIGAVASLLPESVCRRAIPEAGDHDLRAFRHFGWLMAGTAALWFVLSSSEAGKEARESGLIVSLFPELSAFQDRLFGELGAIRGSVERTAEGVDRLVDLAEEEQTDPALQLSRRGIDRSNEAFREALRRGDSQTVGLFLATDWQVKPNDLELFMSGDVFMGQVTEVFQPDVADQLLARSDLMDNAICRPVFLDLYRSGERQYNVNGGFFKRMVEDSAARDFWASLCGRDMLIAHLSAFRDSETARAANNARATSVYRDTLESCLSRLAASQGADAAQRGTSGYSSCENEGRAARRKVEDQPERRDFAPELQALIDVL